MNNNQEFKKTIPGSSTAENGAQIKFKPFVFMPVFKPLERSKLISKSIKNSTSLSFNNKSKLAYEESKVLFQIDKSDLSRNSINKSKWLNNSHESNFSQFIQDLDLDINPKKNSTDNQSLEVKQNMESRPFLHKPDSPIENKSKGEIKFCELLEKEIMKPLFTKSKLREIYNEDSFDKKEHDIFDPEFSSEELNEEEDKNECNKIFKGTEFFTLHTNGNDKEKNKIELVKSSKNEEKHSKAIPRSKILTTDLRSSAEWSTFNFQIPGKEEKREPKQFNKRLNQKTSIGLWKDTYKSKNVGFISKSRKNIEQDNFIKKSITILPINKQESARNNDLIDKKHSKKKTHYEIKGKKSTTPSTSTRVINNLPRRITIDKMLTKNRSPSKSKTDILESEFAKFRKTKVSSPIINPIIKSVKQSKL